MERKLGLLLLDSDESTHRLCTRLAKGMDFKILTATERNSVLPILQRKEIGAMLIDAGTIADYLDLTQTIKKSVPRIQILIADEKPDIPKAVAAIKAGAFDYLEKPLDETILENAIAHALVAYRNFEASVVPLEELERKAIENALAQANGDKIEAARLLSIGKTTLYRKLREYGGHRPKGPRVSRTGTD